MHNTKGEVLKAGTYGTWPAGMKHFVWVKGEIVVQFHGEGPWVIEYITPRTTHGRSSKSTTRDPAPNLTGLDWRSSGYRLIFN